MRPRSKLSSAQAEEARRLRESSPSVYTWKALAKKFRCHAETVKRAIDPSFADSERDRHRRRRDDPEARSHFHQMRMDGLRLLRQIPDDTRDLTSRLLGDPMPGRSALDRRPPA